MQVSLNTNSSLELSQNKNLQDKNLTKIERFVELDISQEAKDLNQKNKIQKNQESSQTQCSGGGGNPMIQFLMDKLAKVLAQIAKLTKQLQEADEKMQEIIKTQLESLYAQAGELQSKIQELINQESQTS